MASKDISVVVRSCNDAAIIGRTLAALARQSLAHETLCFDNASSDGTREIIARFGHRVHDVPAGSYVPGRVLNAAVAAARHPIVAFVNSDAPPLHDDYLAEITGPIREGRAEATWARQVPRPEARAMTRLDHERLFGATPPPPSWGPRFSLANSAIAGDWLRRHPFREDIQYSEDLAWVVALGERVRVLYVPTARAEHSHDYTVRQAARRFFEEGRADAVIFADGGRPLRPLRTGLGLARDVLRDARAGLAAGELSVLLRSPAFRAVQRYAYVAGRCAGPRDVG